MLFFSKVSSRAQIKVSSRGLILTKTTAPIHDQRDNRECKKAIGLDYRMLLKPGSTEQETSTGKGKIRNWNKAENWK